MELIIREAQISDVDEIKELWKEFIDFHKIRDPFFTRTSDGHEHFGKFAQESIVSDEWIVLVATDREKLIGYCMATIKDYPPVYVNPRCGLVQDIAVAQKYRRKGVGSQFFSRVIPWFVKKGVSRVELEVTVTNEVSQAFWYKLGFRDFMKKLAKDL